MATCIITGAASGIGRATAIKLSENGYYKKIALVGRDGDRLEETKRMMSGNVDAKGFVIDLKNLDAIPQLVKGIYEEFRSIDCLLNIAGYTDPQPLLNTSIASVKETYEINVFAPLILSRECVKHMKRKGGKILNVASTAGQTPRPGWISYASSKAAIIAASQTMTEELAEYNIQVFCVSPGRCATKLRKRLAPDEDSSTIMQPEEVADIISDLICSKYSCLDGQNIVIRKKIKR